MVEVSYLPDTLVDTKFAKFAVDTKLVRLAVDAKAQFGS
jgi:hypothetical protein